MSNNINHSSWAQKGQQWGEEFKEFGLRVPGGSTSLAVAGAVVGAVIGYAVAVPVIKLIDKIELKPSPLVAPSSSWPYILDERLNTIISGDMLARIGRVAFSSEIGMISACAMDMVSESFSPNFLLASGLGCAALTFVLPSVRLIAVSSMVVGAIFGFMTLPTLVENAPHIGFQLGTWMDFSF